MERYIWSTADKTMIIKLLLNLIIGLFLLKIIWNILIPFELNRKKYKNNNEKGISIFPIIEIFFLLFAFILSLFSNGDSFFENSKNILAIGFALIILSYLLMALFGVLIGWIRSK